LKGVEYLQIPSLEGFGVG